MRRNDIAAALAVICTVPLLSASAAQGSAIVEQDVLHAPISFDDTSPCTNELVHFEGGYTLVRRFISDAGGGVHWTFNRFHIHALGTSESGTSYSYATGGGDFTNGEPWFEFPVRADSFSTSFRAVVASHGGDENWIASGVFHTTLTPAGPVTQFDNTHASCVA